MITIIFVNYDFKQLILWCFDFMVLLYGIDFTAQK